MTFLAEKKKQQQTARTVLPGEVMRCRYQRWKVSVFGSFFEPKIHQSCLISGGIEVEEFSLSENGIFSSYQLVQDSFHQRYVICIEDIPDLPKLGWKPIGYGALESPKTHPIHWVCYFPQEVHPVPGVCFTPWSAQKKITFRNIVNFLSCAHNFPTFRNASKSYYFGGVKNWLVNRVGNEHSWSYQHSSWIV